jgi:hypothetical protein
MLMEVSGFIVAASLLCSGHKVPLRAGGYPARVPRSIATVSLSFLISWCMDSMTAA